jgi:hypothetical protein
MRSRFSTPVSRLSTAEDDRVPVRLAQARHRDRGPGGVFEKRVHRPMLKPCPWVKVKLFSGG